MNSIDQKSELEKYLDEANMDGDEKFDVLLWWKKNCLRFPVLSIMARDVFATPVSTVASESAFSTDGRVLDTFRSCLNPEMAEALICTQNWMMPSTHQFKDLNIQEEFENSDKIVTCINTLRLQPFFLCYILCLMCILTSFFPFIFSRITSAVIKWWRSWTICHRISC